MKKMDLRRLDAFLETHRHVLKIWFVVYIIGGGFDFWRKSSLDWLANGISALVFLYCARCVVVFFKAGKVEVTPVKMWATFAICLAAASVCLLLCILSF